jgi:trehalose 6-phosphate phosphatase
MSQVALTLLSLLDLEGAAIFLDVDGTLLDLAPTPDAVKAPPPLRENLAALSRLCGDALALLSGRRIADLDAILSPLKLPAAGAHGAELRLAPGDGVRRLAPEIPEALRARFLALADRDGAILEDKGAAIALHYRLAPDFEIDARKMAALEAQAQAAGFALLRGKKVLELKPARLDKGTALAEFMTRAPFAGRRPFFAGDDATDEAAFSALAKFGGVGVGVGRKFPGADFFVRSPEEMRALIAALAGRARP